MKDHDHLSQCPACHNEHTGAAGLIDEDRPHDGDVSICFFCAAALVFDANVPGGLRVPSQQEIAVLEQDPVIIEAQAAIRTLRGAL